MKGKNELWVLARQSHGQIDPISFELIAWARELIGDAKLTVFVCGPSLSELKLVPLAWYGADRILTLEADVSELDVPFWVNAFVQLYYTTEIPPEAVIAGADSYGRTFLPYLAMSLKTGLTADCTKLEWDAQTGALLQTRPATGGNIMATIRCQSRRPQLATVRPRSRKPLEPDTTRRATLARFTKWIGSGSSTKRIKFDSFIPNPATATIQDADKIVAVGRGIKRPENLPMIYRLADRLGAKVGASREVVDRGWIPWSNQVGLSGKTVTPRLYVAIGISGAIQHLAGMQTAETIIAINRDPDAPIFKVADFGIVGDLMEVVPAWIDRLEKGSK